MNHLKPEFEEPTSTKIAEITRDADSQSDKELARQFQNFRDDMTFELERDVTRRQGLEHTSTQACPYTCDFPSDLDGDSVACTNPRGSNCTDNCPFDSNPEQADGNEDGLGDGCSDDYDNDGVPDVSMQTPTEKTNAGTPERPLAATSERVAASAPNVQTSGPGPPAFKEHTARRDAIYPI